MEFIKLLFLFLAIIYGVSIWINVKLNIEPPGTQVVILAISVVTFLTIHFNWL